MHLIFVRHGDPDYSIDSLTEKGVQEAEALSERVKEWPITQSYTSPMGRAKRTARIALGERFENIIELPWLQEFSYRIKDPVTDKPRIPWDWLPKDYFAEKKYSLINEFHQTEAMKSGDIESHYKEVCSGFDKILEEYGYRRLSEDVPVYLTEKHLTEEEAQTDTHLNAWQKNLDERNLVFFCHLGVMFAILSHLSGVSPVQLWQGFFVAPTSVTVVGAEERIPGEVAFRTQCVGDCTHLLKAGQFPSASGYFGNCFAL